MYRQRPFGRIIIAAEPLGRPSSSSSASVTVPPSSSSLSADSANYAATVRQQLIDRGYRVSEPQLHPASDALWIEFSDGEAFFRQAVIVRDNVGFSVTLAAADSATRAQHLRAFDSVLRSIEWIPRQRQRRADDANGDEFDEGIRQCTQAEATSTSDDPTVP